jgi:hypothetical protein
VPSTRTVLALGIAAVTGLSLPALADKPGDTDTNKTSGGTQSRTCDSGTVALAGPQVLFPPNHKMVDETGHATSTGLQLPGGTTTLTLNAADVADVVGGDGNTEVDSSAASTGVSPSGSRTATVPYQVRAERSGKGDGRTYTIGWTATFDDGSTCTSEDDGQSPFTVTVPHDQGTTK